MNKKNDYKVWLGILILALIIIISVYGYKKFGNNVAVPQVGDGIITEEKVDVLPTGSELLDKKDKQSMNPVQIIKKDNGLVIEIISEGAGEGVRSMQTVSVDYRGMLTDGKVFDESYKRGQQFSFTVGGGQVIKGWDEGLLGMKVGEKRRLTIPGDLAYGPNGIPGVIPANATLIFDIELHSIK